MADHITVQGIERVINMFGMFMSVSTAQLVSGMDQATKLIHAEIAKYPPQMPGSEYRRTGRLGRSWKTSVTKDSSGNVIGMTYSDVADFVEVGYYTPMVQGPQQEPMFIERNWTSITQVADDLAPQINNIFQQQGVNIVTELLGGK